MNTRQIKVTKKGLDELELELDELVNKKRPKVVERLEYARQEGDLKENSDYTSAKEELEFLDGRIDELKHVVDNSQVVNESSDEGKIDVGTTVILENGNGKHEYKIVGEWEADPMKRKISHESPLGKELVGKAKGQEVEVEAPAGKIIYKIIEIK